MKQEKQSELIPSQPQDLMSVAEQYAEHECIDARNIVIPKLLVQQGLSKFVGEGNAKMGDICDSLTGEVLAVVDPKSFEYKEPVRFVPFHHQDLWIISEKKGDKFVYSKQEPTTADNENRPWDEVIDGKLFKNTRCLYFYVLLEKDPTIPYILSFKSTSLRAGKILFTQMFVKNQLRANGKIFIVPPLKIMELGAVKTSNDSGVFAVMTTKVCENTPDDLLKQCSAWKKRIAAGKAIADESDNTTESTEVVSPSKPIGNVGNQF